MERSEIPSVDTNGSGSTPGPQLARTLSPFLLLLFIVGDMVGAGIIALLGVIAGVTGGAIWTAFLLALVLALFTAFAFAELVTKYPYAGGTATWVHFAFKTPFVTFMVGFAVIMSGVTSASALSSVFAEFLSEIVAVPITPAALIFMLVVALINYRGISESGKVNAGLTLVTLFGFLLIVLAGVVALFAGVGDPARAFEFKEGTSIPIAIVAGAALAFYPLVGFEDSVNFVEETQNPRRSYPLALFGGLVLAGSLYLVLTIIASMVVPTAQLEGSDVSLLEVVRNSPLQIPIQFFSFIALAAVANTALVNMIMASRLAYGMGNRGVLPYVFSRVHARRRTPWVAIVFTTPIALILIATGGFAALASTTVVLLLLIFITVNIAVLKLKRERVDRDHFHAPVVFPLLGIAVSIGLLTQVEGTNFLRAGGLLLVGLALWGANFLIKKRMDRSSLESPRE